MGRPTSEQAHVLERAETRMLRLTQARECLSLAQIRLGQLRGRVGYKDLVDFALGDVAEAHALLAAEWQDSTGDREKVSAEIRGK